LIYRPKLCAYLFGNGTLDDALAIMGGFDSAMDEPVMLMPGLTKALMDQQLDRLPRENPPELGNLWESTDGLPSKLA